MTGLISYIKTRMKKIKININTFIKLRKLHNSSIKKKMRYIAIDL